MFGDASVWTDLVSAPTEYKKNEVLIPKNTSLVVKRVPAANGAPVKKFWYVGPADRRWPTLRLSYGIRP